MNHVGIYYSYLTENFFKEIPADFRDLFESEVETRGFKEKVVLWLPPQDLLESRYDPDHWNPILSISILVEVGEILQWEEYWLGFLLPGDEWSTSRFVLYTESLDYEKDPDGDGDYQRVVGPIHHFPDDMDGALGRADYLMEDVVGTLFPKIYNPSPLFEVEDYKRGIPLPPERLRPPTPEGSILDMEWNFGF